jgi:hypothetical protein
MQRTVKFYVKIPEVEIEHLQDPYGHDGIDEKAILNFPFMQGNIAGTISLTLDPDEYSWTIGTDEADEEIDFPYGCGGIIVCVSGQSDNDFEPTEFLEIAHELAVEYTSKLTAYLAVQLDQYWIHLGRMPEWTIEHFISATEAKWINEDKESSVIEDAIRPIKIFNTDIPDFHDSAIRLNEKAWNGFYLWHSAERFEPDLAETLLSNAKRYFANGDYPMAAVQAVTALDLKVEPFVEQRCKARNISGSKFKETNRFLAEYLKVILPLVLQENELSDWIAKKFSSWSALAETTQWTGETILEKCIILNTTRNNVAHRGKFEQADISKVRQGIEAAELLLDFMGDAVIGE